MKRLKSMRSNMSLITRTILSSIVVGVLCLLSGICIQLNKTVFLIIASIFLFSACILFIFVEFDYEDDIDDERSELNSLKARASAYTAILAGLLLYDIVISIQLIFGKDIFMLHGHGWTMIFIGAIKIIEGILFCLNEKNN